MMTWNKPYIAGWIALTVIVIAYELVAVLDKTYRTPPLTWVTVRFLPWYVTMSFLTWLWIHFAIRYANPEYITHLLGK